VAATVLAQQTYTTTLTSRTITLTTSATAGRRVFLVFMNSNGTATGVTDTAGNTWTKEVTATGVTSPIVPTDIWSTPQTTNLASGAVITVTNAGGANAHIYVIDPGVDLGTRDDVDGAFGNSATAAVTSTTLGTNRWELGVVSYGAANTTAPTVSGWTQVGTVTNTASTRSIWLGEKTQAAAGSSALSATLPASNQWVALQTAYPYTIPNPTGGTGAAQSLGLTNGSATGSRTGSGASQTLGLTLGTGTGVAATYPAISTLTEDWSGGISSAKWNSQSTPAVVAGRLQADNGGTYEGVNTTGYYNAVGGGVVVEIPTVPPNETSREAIVSLVLGGSPVQKVELMYTGSTGGTAQLLARRWSGATQTSIGSTNYNATSMRWWRVRESAGTWFFDTSPDGQTWTNRFSWLSTFISPDAIKVDLNSGNWNGLATSGMAEFDNINLPPTNPTTGTGAAQTLALTNGTATGSRTGTGAAQTLAIATGSATGAWQGTGGTLTLGLVAGTATGFTPLTMSGGGESLNLPLTVGVAEGQGYRWVLNPPTEPYYFPLLERSKLIGVIPRGLALLRIGGQWVTDFSPTPAQVDAADRIYEGGRYHPLTEDQRAELIDAGLGDLVSLEAL
jgi:hypothetical protein